MDTYNYMSTYKNFSIRIRISFVTHTIIGVFILGYRYNYMSSCT